MPSKRPSKKRSEDGGPCLSGEIACLGQRPASCVDGTWQEGAACTSASYCAGGLCVEHVNAWTSEPSLPITRSGLAAATTDDGRVYALGGYTVGTSANAR